MDRQADQRAKGGVATRRRGLLLAVLPVSLLLLGVLLLGGLIPAAAGRAFAAESEGFRIVVHPQNPLSQVERAVLADIFLKKTTRWPDGAAAHPVDQHSESAVRERFSVRVLKRSVFAVRSYWQQRIFSGRGLPPPELAADDAVLRYVQANRGAVGYVSEQIDVSKLKVLQLR